MELNGFEQINFFKYSRIITRHEARLGKIARRRKLFFLGPASHTTVPIRDQRVSDRLFITRFRHIPGILNVGTISLSEILPPLRKTDDRRKKAQTVSSLGANTEP